jgi:tyrosine-protein phosphatase SIW14
MVVPGNPGSGGVPLTFTLNGVAGTLNSLATPSDEEISTVLALLKSPDAGPVFVHCRRGADRTGTVIACYRIEHDRWRNQTALKEAESYGMSWMEIGMKRYVLKFSASREH